MEFFKRKGGVIVALVCIAAAAAVVWFCLAGGNRQSSPGGTLVRLNGAPVYENAKEEAGGASGACTDGKSGVGQAAEEAA